MKPAALPIDFARVRLTRSTAAVGIAASILALALGVTWWTGEQRVLDLHRELAAAEREARVATRPAPRLTPEIARAVNEAIVRLNTPWDRLFVVLNAAGAQTKPGAVALLSLEPDAAGQAVKVTAEARNVEAMLAYQRALQYQPAVQSAVLTRHEVVAGSAVRFWIETRLTPQP